MTDMNPGFFGRIGIAFGAFFGLLGDAEFAAACSACAKTRSARSRARSGARTPRRTRTAPAPTRAVRAEAKQARRRAAAARPAAARSPPDRLRRTKTSPSTATPTSAPPPASCTKAAHACCASTSRSSPCAAKLEGARVTLPEGFDAASVRLTGNVVGKAPFTGTLSHRGWRVEDVRLPQARPTARRQHHRAGGGGAVSAYRSNENTARYAIGIDLGTTHSALSYVDLQRQRRRKGRRRACCRSRS